jgi:hypothetical protein
MVFVQLVCFTILLTAPKTIVAIRAPKNAGTNAISITLGPKTLKYGIYAPIHAPISATSEAIHPSPGILPGLMAFPSHPTRTAIKTVTIKPPIYSSSHNDLIFINILFP